MDTFSAAMKTAFITRNTAWKAALFQTTAKLRRAAVLAADRQFNKDVRSARSAYNAARKSAWDQVKAARKTCRGGTSVPTPASGAERL